jgi:hypothetical protein
MNGMSAPPSREAAWARAFRAKLHEAAALGGERGRPDLGRAPSRLWLMEPDELERLPIRDFIAAFEVPGGAVSRHRQRPPHRPRESGAGDVPRGTSSGQRPAVAVPSERPRCRGPSSHSPPNTWWSYPVRVSLAAAAAVGLLTG